MPARLNPSRTEREESATTPTESRFSIEASIAFGYAIQPRALGPAQEDVASASNRLSDGHRPSSGKGSDVIRVPAAPAKVGVSESWGVFSQMSRTYVVPSVQVRKVPISCALTTRSYARLSPAARSPRFFPGRLTHASRSC